MSYTRNAIRDAEKRGDYMIAAVLRVAESIEGLAGAVESLADSGNAQASELGGIGEAVSSLNDTLGDAARRFST